jgi:hypothetical protein
VVDEDVECADGDAHPATKHAATATRTRRRIVITQL